jgi:hypothetical protein
MPGSNRAKLWRSICTLAKQGLEVVNSQHNRVPKIHIKQVKYSSTMRLTVSASQVLLKQRRELLVQG